MKSKPSPRDESASKARAAEIQAADQVPYWIVVSALDIVSLCEGVVPDEVKYQALKQLHPMPAESRAAYLARLEEVTA